MTKPSDASLAPRDHVNAAWRRLTLSTASSETHRSLWAEPAPKIRRLPAIRVTGHRRTYSARDIPRSDEPALVTGPNLSGRWGVSKTP